MRQIAVVGANIGVTRAFDFLGNGEETGLEVQPCNSFNFLAISG